MTTSVARKFGSITGDASGSVEFRLTVLRLVDATRLVSIVNYCPIAGQHHVHETDGLVRARTHADDVARVPVQLERELARQLLRCLHLLRRTNTALREPLVSTRCTMRASEGHG
jgi:hypothetical protein